MASHKTLLIADDSQGKIDLIYLMLAHFGWTIEPLIAKTTEDAMQLIDTNNITHAFVDYYIPSKNGPALIRALKEKNPAIRVALVSSSDKKSNWDEAIAAGAEMCICTSYSSDEVGKAFSDVLEAWKNGQ